MGSRFKIVRKLGEGGMATVFLATQRGASGRTEKIALKKMRREAMDDPDQLDLFLREARVAVRLRHPGVVQIFDAGLEGDELFLALEYVDGPDLESVIDALRRGKTRLGPALVAWVGIQVCEALAYVKTIRDERGKPLVQAHRDISPSNVLVSARGEVKLADFGVVRLSTSKTAVGIVKGKWEYFAPEIITGKPQDMRGDLFALGITLYKLHALVHPFRAPTPMEHFQRARTEDPARPPDLPEGLWRVLRGALDRDPDKRFPTPDAMADALRGWLAQAGEQPSEKALARRLTEIPLATPLQGTQELDVPDLGDEPSTRAEGDDEDQPTLPIQSPGRKPPPPPPPRAALPTPPPPPRTRTEPPRRPEAFDDDDDEKTELGIPSLMLTPTTQGEGKLGKAARLSALYDELRSARARRGLNMDMSPREFDEMLRRREAEILVGRPGAQVTFTVGEREGKPVIIPKVTRPKA